MEEHGAEWLPVVEFDGVEYVVDVLNRTFRLCRDPDDDVSFYSQQGRAMVEAMAGTEWRAWTPREVWEKEGAV